MLPLSQSHSLTPMRSKPPRTYIRWAGTALDRQDPRWQAAGPWTSCPTAEESVVSVTPSVGRAQTFPLDLCQRPFRVRRPRPAEMFRISKTAVPMSRYVASPLPAAAVKPAAVAAAGGPRGTRALGALSGLKPDNAGTEKPVGDGDPAEPAVLSKRPVHELHYRPLRASLHQDYVKRKTANHNVFRGMLGNLVCPMTPSQRSQFVVSLLMFTIKETPLILSHVAQIIGRYWAKMTPQSSNACLCTLTAERRVT
jgi:hypothetical protein